MVQNSPSVQILIPTYNRSRFLYRAVTSSLSQSYQNLQVLISDNHSSDSTPSVGQALERQHPGRVSYFRNRSNLGMTGNWIKLLKEYATADYCLLLSDDDFFIDSSYIEECVSKLLIAKERYSFSPSLVFGDLIVLQESDDAKHSKLVRFGWPEVITDRILLRYWRKLCHGSFNHIPLCACLFDRSIALKFSPFESPYLSADFQLWWNMILRSQPGIYIPKVSTAYVLHGANEADRHKYSFADFIRNYETYLQPFESYVKSLPPFDRLKSYFSLRRILSCSLRDNAGKDLGFLVYPFFAKVYHVSPRIFWYLLITFLLTPVVWLYIPLRRCKRFLVAFFAR